MPEGGRPRSAMASAALSPVKQALARFRRAPRQGLKRNGFARFDAVALAYAMLATCCCMRCHAVTVEVKSAQSSGTRLQRRLTACFPCCMQLANK